MTGISETDETELRIEAFNTYMEENPDLAKRIGTSILPEGKMTFQYLQENSLRVEEMLEDLRQCKTFVFQEFEDTVEQLEEEQTQ